MKLVERLRSVVRQGRPATTEDADPREAGPAAAASRSRPSAGDVAEALGGEWRNEDGPAYLVVDRTYHPGYCLGHVAVADCLPGDDGQWPRLGLLMTGPAGTHVPAGRLLFLDLETTGLAGGAGTYAFLVGCGWFDGPRFRVRQFVLSSFAAERPLLEDVAALLRSSGALVTYNGKTFDAPLIDTRFLFHRLDAPCGDLAHIDLLHPARRLWRPSGDLTDEGPAACRLSSMESTVLGHAREDDVAGFEIPSRYFQYVRSGDARVLTAVLEHNRLDLLALAMLTARASQLLDEGASGAQTAREALGLGRLYERGGLASDARACFLRATQLDGDVHTHAAALRSFAVLCRRERHYLQAAEAWRRLLELQECSPRLAQEALNALAVHHEHRARDLCTARHFAVQSLQFESSSSRTRAVHHRLARIDRKIGANTPHSAQLF